MTDKDTKPTPEDRENLRKDELAMLQSEAAKNLYISAIGKDVTRYGTVENKATITNYILALSQPDDKVGKLTSGAFQNEAFKAIKYNKDPRDSGAITPGGLLEIIKKHNVPLNFQS